jgi:hypothetical protein
VDGENKKKRGEVIEGDGYIRLAGCYIFESGRTLELS